MKQSWQRFAPLVLVVLTLALYWPALHFQFIEYDDPDYVTSNSHVQQGLTIDNLKWALTTSHASNWHPLTWCSHMLDCSLFGTNAVAHHFTNIILHALNAMLLFLLMQRMTGRSWPAFFVAALFAWHPLRVESVAWVSERKDVLSTLFWLLATFAYVRHVEGQRNSASQKPVFYVLAFLLFSLGLMAKPMLVTWPFTLLLLDWWPLQRLRNAQEVRASLIEKIPMFIMVGASCMLTYSAQSSGGRFRRWNPSLWA